ncbi:hypothetical protein J6590_006700 [Homalodisca vitripennis]|nr:hypothetical protein J6590_006700 [Homalodisca vitripennis]
MNPGVVYCMDANHEHEKSRAQSHVTPAQAKMGYCNTRLIASRPRTRETLMVSQTTNLQLNKPKETQILRREQEVQVQFICK